MEKFIKDKTVLITGASAGIGEALAIEIQKYSPKSMILLSRSSEKLMLLKNKMMDLPNNHTQIEVISVDITDENHLNKALEQIKNQFKEIHILINNAGYLVNKLFLEQDKEDLNRQFYVNYIAPSLIIKGLFPLINSSEHARIMNISSMGGYQGSSKFSGLSHYSASKGALAVLSECLAVEFQEFNINVNAIALGAINTQMLRAAFPTYQAPLEADELAEFVCNILNSRKMAFNGQVIPLALNNPN